MNLKPDLKNKYKRIPNPTVHIAFNQLRLVVNDIIRVYGKPSQVVIETARDLPHGAETIREREKDNKKNKEENKKAREAIEEYNQIYNRENRIRYHLWKQQKQICTYSGKKNFKEQTLDCGIRGRSYLTMVKDLR